MIQLTDLQYDDYQTTKASLGNTRSQINFKNLSLKRFFIRLPLSQEVLIIFVEQHQYLARAHLNFKGSTDVLLRFYTC